MPANAIDSTRQQLTDSISNDNLGEFRNVLSQLTKEQIVNAGERRLSTPLLFSPIADKPEYLAALFTALKLNELSLKDALEQMNALGFDAVFFVRCGKNSESLRVLLGHPNLPFKLLLKKLQETHHITGTPLQAIACEASLLSIFVEESPNWEQALQALTKEAPLEITPFYAATVHPQSLHLFLNGQFTPSEIKNALAFIGNHTCGSALSNLVTNEKSLTLLLNFNGVEEIGLTDLLCQQEEHRPSALHHLVSNPKSLALILESDKVDHQRLSNAFCQNDYFYSGSPLFLSATKPASFTLLSSYLKDHGVSLERELTKQSSYQPNAFINTSVNAQALALTLAELAKPLRLAMAVTENIAQEPLFKQAHISKASQTTLLKSLPKADARFLQACLLPVIGDLLYKSLTIAMKHPGSQTTLTTALVAAAIGLLAITALVIANILSLGTVALVGLGVATTVATTAAATTATAGFFAKRIQASQAAVAQLQSSEEDQGDQAAAAMSQ